MERLVYDIDAQRGLPDGWTFTRAASAWRRASPVQWQAVQAGPAWDLLTETTSGLRLEPASGNLLPQLPDWAGAGAFSFESSDLNAVLRRPAREVHGLGNEDVPVLETDDPGTASTQVTLWVLLEALDAERFAAGFRDGGAWYELLHARYADGSVLEDSGTGEWVHQLEALGTGPGGATLWRMRLSGPRWGVRAALAPLGLYASHLRARVYHVQLEELPGPSSPVAPGASRDADTLTAARDGLQLPTTLSVVAVTAPWSGRRQPLWQVDDGTDANALVMVRDEDARLVLEAWQGGVLAWERELVAQTNEGQSFGVALTLAEDGTLSWSVNGSAAVTETVPPLPGVAAERLGCSAGEERWGGHVVYARRWQDVASDLAALSQDPLGLAGTAPVFLPAFAVSSL